MKTTTLKIIALIMMVMDHIGLFIPGSPLWLHWLGRIAAPIFIFCLAWGFDYTRSKRNYLARLYIASVIMSFVPLLAYKLYPFPQYYTHIELNIFRTLFSIAVILCLIDLYRQKRPHVKKYIVFYMLWQIISMLAIVLLIQNTNLDESYAYILSAVCGNLLVLEGGIVFVALGVLLYLTKDSKKKLAIAYTAFVLLYFLAVNFDAVNKLAFLLESCRLAYPAAFLSYINGIILDINWLGVTGFDTLLTVNYQWFMLGALPFMLLYNGQRGANLKYFFYVFYPAHIVILFYMGGFIYHAQA